VHVPKLTQILEGSNGYREEQPSMHQALFRLTTSLLGEPGR